MTHGSLFSGVGGFDLAAEWMGWENVFHCEVNKKSREKLNHYWPQAVSYADIKTTDFRVWRGKLDIISGGDPCQPSSIAGLGKGTSDDRYLWPEMFRAAIESECPYIVNENVTGTISNGTLDIKIDGLESSGYAWQAFNIPAEAVGALHQRERIWLVAYNADFNAKSRTSRRISKEKSRKKRNTLQHTWEPVDLRDVGFGSNGERFEELNDTKVSRVLPEGVSRYFGFGSHPHGNIPGTLLNPELYECLMGYPKGWTTPNGTNVSKNLETQLSRKSCMKSSNQ